MRNIVIYDIDTVHVTPRESANMQNKKKCLQR